MPAVTNAEHLKRCLEDPRSWRELGPEEVPRHRDIQIWSDYYDAQPVYLRPCWRATMTVQARRDYAGTLSAGMRYFRYSRGSMQHYLGCEGCGDKSEPLRADPPDYKELCEECRMKKL